MMTLVWRTATVFYSAGDELAYFSWLHSIPGVMGVEGQGRELHIQLRSKRLSDRALRELLGLYRRYGGRMRELAQFETPTNRHWFKDPSAVWYRKLFGRR